MSSPFFFCPIKERDVAVRGIILLASVTLAVLLASGVAPKSDSIRAQDLSGKPNILFIQTDDLDRRTYELAMKNTQALIEDMGIRFDNATFSHSVCCPSRASILRGQYTHNTGVWKNEPPNGGFESFKARGLNNDTYATRLNAVGYNTAYFGKYMNGYPKRGQIHTGRRHRYYKPPGWDLWYGSTKNISNTLFINSKRRAVDPKGAHDVVVGRESVRWLQRAVESRTPFLGAINFHAPHVPSWYPTSYRNRFASAKLGGGSFNEADVSDKPAFIRREPRFGPKVVRNLAVSHRKRLRSAAFVDAQVGKLISILRSSGELDDTYIFFYSDNGYHLGEHRLTGRGGVGSKATPYIEDVRFPIILRAPGIQAGQTSEAMVQNIDLRPTFEDIANARRAGYVDGTSLLPTAARGAQFPRTFAYAEALGAGEVSSWKAVYTANEAYHLWGTDEKEFYDLRTDPHQLRSTPADPRTALLQQALSEMKACKGAECYR